MTLQADPLGQVRFTSGASVAPDASAVAHLVDDGGYPRAVQRFLTGRHAQRARWVELPVAGPITAVAYSPDSRWLACQLAPDAGTRTQVWLVTNDPDDPSSWPLGTRADSSLELVGWDGPRVALHALDEAGVGEARLVDPHTQRVEVIDRRRLGHLTDAWNGDALLRVGPRGYRHLVMLGADRSEVPLLPADEGSVTDHGVLVSPLRARYAAHRPFVLEPTRARSRGALVRSDVDADRARLLAIDITEEGPAPYRVIAERADAELDEFVVSDDGRTVALVWNRAGCSELTLLPLRDGVPAGPERPLTIPGLVASQPSISADGALLAVTVEGPGAPPAVELIDTRSADLGPVEPALLDLDRAHLPQRHELPARDGLVLNGWYYRASGQDLEDGPGQEPPGPGHEQQGHSPRPGPCILYFHGGPEAESRPSYSPFFPALTDAGFNVFTPNVRGSTGSGREYAHADEGPRRAAGIEDVADCVAFLVANGLADPSRIGVAGRSYGGYLTYAALTWYPDLFAAGVAVCGMSDLETFYADTEPWIAEAAYPKYGHPVRDAALLRELSPIHRIDDLTAPLLAVHGAHDTNVPVAESQRAVSALRDRGRTTDLLLFPDEGHEIVTRENQDRLAAAMVDWFTRHLPAVVPVAPSGSARGR